MSQIFDKIIDMRINVGILENEVNEAKTTALMIDKFFQSIDCEYTFSSFNNSKDFLGSNIDKYDILILDILLDEGDGLNGIQVAQEIRAKNNKVAILFVTKTSQFALDGYKVDAIDYILKPLVYEDFYLKLIKTMNYIRSNVDKEIVIKTSEGLLKLKESDIFYIEVMKHYLTFHTKMGDIVSRGAIKDVEEILSKKFAKTSKSFIANLNYVSLVKKDEVDLTFNAKTFTIPLTKLFKDSFIFFLQEYAGKN